MNGRTLIFNLTVEQLEEVVANAVASTIDKQLDAKMPKATSTNMRGLAKTLGISVSYAHKLKAKGIFDEAINQQARTMLVDNVKLQQLWAEYTNKN